MSEFNAAEAEVLMMGIIEPHIRKAFEGAVAHIGKITKKWEFQDLLDLCEESEGKKRPTAQELDIDYDDNYGVRIRAWRQNDDES